MIRDRRPGLQSAFSLMEVVVATAIFAGAIIAVVGLLGPLTKRVNDVIDSETAARLSASIQAELERLGFANAVSITTAPAVELVANTQATQVRVASGASPAADNPLNDSNLPGIAQRDRYFRIILTRQVGVLAYLDGTSGALALRAEVEWPFRIPVGPSTGTNEVHGDPSSVVPPEQRQRMSYFFAIRP